MHVEAGTGHGDGYSPYNTTATGHAHLLASASQAAFRRAADLLRICGAQRRKRLRLVDGAYEGTLALSRKLRYTGYIQGLMSSGGGNTGEEQQAEQDGVLTSYSGVDQKAVAEQVGFLLAVFKVKHQVVVVFCFVAKSCSHFIGFKFHFMHQM